MLRSFGLLATLMLATGCEEVSRTRVKTVDDVIERTPKTVFQNQFSGDAVIDEGRLTVRVEPACSLVEMETVETTTVYEKKALSDDERTWMGALGGASVVPVGGGIALLADSGNVYEDDPNQRLYNSNGQDSAIIGGVILLLVGAAMATPPIVNAFRYVGDEEETGKPFERQGQTLRSGVTCGGSAGQPAFALTARFGAFNVPIGQGTGPAKTVIDLKSKLPVSVLDAAPTPVSAAIYANESFLAEVRIAEVVEQLRKDRGEQDDLTWRTGEPGACESQRNEQACAGVRRYLSAFPAGRHAKEAQALVARINAATAPPPGPPVKAGPAIAEDPGKSKLDAARRAAAEAAAKAAEAAEKKRREDEALRAKKAAEDAQKASKKACTEACVAACGKDATCRSTCSQEVCK